MQPSKRKNRHRSNQNSYVEEPIHHLAAFIRNQYSPPPIGPQEVNSALSSLRTPNFSAEGRERSELQQIRIHYQNVQRILNEQNLNLKMQTKYLANEVRKSLKRQKAHKEEFARIQQHLQYSQHQYQQLQIEYSQLKDYVDAIAIQLLNALNLHPNKMVDQLKRITQDLCKESNIAFEAQNSQHQTIPINRQRSSIEDGVGDRIEELNNKFESLMGEYKITSTPEIRKKCIEIAKQIRGLKVKRDKSITESQPDRTVQQLSRQQSKQYIFIRERASLNRQKAQNQHSPIHGHRISEEIARKQQKQRPSSFRHISNFH